MPNPPILSGDLWLQVLVYLDYFDLCRIKRVSKLFNDCCKVRSVQEDLFLAPFQERSVTSKYEAGEKEVQIHPALSDVVYVLENGLLTLAKYGKPWNGTFQIKKVTRKAFVSKSKIAPLEAIEESYHKLDDMGDLGFENATNPPVYNFRILDRNWNTDELRDFRYRINDRSRAKDQVPTQSKTSSSSSPATSKFEPSNLKAVTINDILGALSVHFEKVEGQLGLDWEDWPFDFDVEDPEERELKEYNLESDSFADLYLHVEEEEDEDEDFCEHEAFVDGLEPWDETCGEWEDEWYDRLCQFAPLCSCRRCQLCHLWNDKCWERFIQLQESKAEAMRNQETDQMNSSAVVICKSEINSELRLYAKGGIVADLNHIKFAK